MARKSSASWPSELPRVLLGLRSVPLEASGVSSTEMVFRSLTSLPGQFLSVMEIPPDQFLDSLHCLMDPFQPPPLVHGSSPPSEAEFIFVHCNGTKPPLSPLYNGPYRVVSRSLAFFCPTINRG